MAILATLAIAVCPGSARADDEGKKPNDPLLGTAIVHDGPLWTGRRWAVKVDGIEYAVGEIGPEKTLAFADSESSPGLKQLHVLRCPDLGRAKGLRLMEGKAALLTMTAVHKKCFKLTRGPTGPDGMTEFTVTSRLDDEEQEGEPRLPGEKVPSFLDRPDDCALQSTPAGPTIPPTPPAGPLTTSTRLLQPIQGSSKNP